VCAVFFWKEKKRKEKKRKKRKHPSPVYFLLLLRYKKKEMASSSSTSSLSRFSPLSTNKRGQGLSAFGCHNNFPYWHARHPLNVPKLATSSSKSKSKSKRRGGYDHRLRFGGDGGDNDGDDNDSHRLEELTSSLETWLSLGDDKDSAITATTTRLLIFRTDDPATSGTVIEFPGVVINETVDAIIRSLSLLPNLDLDFTSANVLLVKPPSSSQLTAHLSSPKGVVTATTAAAATIRKRQTRLTCESLSPSLGSVGLLQQHQSSVSGAGIVRPLQETCRVDLILYILPTVGLTSMPLITSPPQQPSSSSSSLSLFTQSTVQTHSVGNNDGGDDDDDDGGGKGRVIKLSGEQTDLLEKLAQCIKEGIVVLEPGVYMVEANRVRTLKDVLDTIPANFSIYVDRVPENSNTLKIQAANVIRVSKDVAIFMKV